MLEARPMQNTMRKLFLLLIPLILIVCLAAGAWIAVPLVAQNIYGAPGRYITGGLLFRYSAMLLWYDGLLTDARDLTAAAELFRVEEGEAVPSVAARLEEAGLIASAEAFRAYLVYAGLDVSLQAGEYQLSAGMTPIAIAQMMQDFTPTNGTLVVLAGWRMDEIAAALPSSGLAITPEDFLAAAMSPRPRPDFIPPSASAEGFLFPGTYKVPRNIPAPELLKLMLENFKLYLTDDLRAAFERQGLSVHQAVTLASIVEREAIMDDEKPIIASVYLNRIKAGMKLEADPTVQYALGYNATQGTWWTNPLSYEDLQYDSPFNTYLNAGLPPAPISNPNLSALNAVAYPAQTPYYFFRARCDGSGRHLFAETYEQHVANACP